MITQAFARFGISPETVVHSDAIIQDLAPVFARIDQTRSINQLRVLHAFHEARLAESSLGGTTGYGYDDSGRDQIEKAYARVFGAEKALVRIQISAGTQALAICFFGLLRPGDTLLSVTGRPYDTLQSTIGVTDDGSPAPDGSLCDMGVHYSELDLLPDGTPDLAGIAKALDDRTKVVFIQKSRGYTTRRSLLVDDIAQIVQTVRQHQPQAIVLVDNCYGEFVETQEPCMVGADLVAGSLIKNPGGGLCPSGGYVAGRADLVEKVASRLTAPGLGSHVGPTLGFSRLIAQGFYLAPQIVAESLKGAAFAAALFGGAGYKTYPDADAIRGDLVQTLEFGDPDRLVAFCQAIQAASPVDSFVRPEPWAMPGYDSPVIMAAGAFVQGSSIELSADGPLKPPFPAYLQGGLNFETVRLACLLAYERMTGKSQPGRGQPGD